VAEEGSVAERDVWREGRRKKEKERKESRNSDGVMEKKRYHARCAYESKKDRR